MGYPYIANNNLMFYAKDTATVIGDKDNLNTNGFKVSANESEFKNVTREYLEGKCVKIESPEHSEFVQKLAFNAGFEWDVIGCVYLHRKAQYLFFRCNAKMEFTALHTDGFDEITIPLPPEADPDDKEWPQVGDEVLFRNDLCKVLLMEDASRHIVVECNGNYVNPHIEDVKKPKTEAEILRDWVQERVGYGIASGFDCEQITHDLFHHCNITKKPQ